MQQAYRSDTDLLPVDAPPSVERSAPASEQQGSRGSAIIRSRLPPLLINVDVPDDVKIPGGDDYSRPLTTPTTPTTPTLVDSRASSASSTSSASLSSRTYSPKSQSTEDLLFESVSTVDYSLPRSTSFDMMTTTSQIAAPHPQPPQPQHCRRRLSLSSSDGSELRRSVISPRFLSVRRTGPHSPMMTPRSTCTICGMPSLRDEHQLLAFHRSVCASLARLQSNPRARQSPRALKRLSRPRLLVDTLADEVVNALRISVPVDACAYVLMQLHSLDVEQRILTDRSIDATQLNLVRPYLVQRLRDTHLEVHRIADNGDGDNNNNNNNNNQQQAEEFPGALEVVMQFNNRPECVSLDRAMDRYASRKHDQWRRRRNNRPHSPPVTPRRIDCVCTTPADLSRVYWECQMIEAVDVSFTPLPECALPPSFGIVPPIFSGLCHLVANHCQIHQLPDSIETLQSLVSLDVAHNCLHELPASIGRLLRLRDIRANSNSLALISEHTFTDLVELRHLDLASNLLTSVPVDELVTLPYLEHVDLSSNRLHEFPRRFGKAPTLRWLSLMGNVPPFEFNELASCCTIVRSLIVVT